MTIPTAVRIGLAAVALLALSSCSSDADWTASGSDAATRSASPSASDSTSKSQPEWLFAVQSSGDTTFDASTGQLSMPTGSVQAFTDRPYRDTKATSPQTFVNLWQSADPDSFEKDPPNAVLTYWDATDNSAVPRTVVCEITGDVGYSTTDGRLSMGLRVLEPKGATLPARMSRASLFVDGVTEPGCVNSPADESNIEYFNILNFGEGIELNVNYVEPTNDYSVAISCPARVSPSIPSTVFDIRLATADGSSTVSCYSTDQITIAKQDLAELAYCNAQNTCRFVISALNTETNQVYSETEYSVVIDTDENIIPELEAATLPVCNR